MIWLITIVMVIVALAIILLPLLRTAKSQAENRSEQNIQIAQDQLLSLKEAKSEGAMNEHDYDLARQDLEKTLHSDLAEQINNVSIESGSAYMTSGILILLLPVFVISLYYSLGNPTTINSDAQQSENSQTKIITSPKSSEKVSDVGSLFEKLKQRLETNPDDGQGWMMMGLTYMHFEQYEQAVIAYEKAVELLPSDVNAQQGLNRALKAQTGGNEATSSEDVIEKKMVALNGQTVDVGAMVMRLRAKLETNPDNPQGWLLLGRSYMSLERYDEAIQAYKKAIILIPDNPEAQEALNNALTSRNLRDK
jgi:cytochrome c-type biogenesis protein CcmH